MPLRGAAPFRRDCGPRPCSPAARLPRPIVEGRGATTAGWAAGYAAGDGPRPAGEQGARVVRRDPPAYRPDAPGELREPAERRPRAQRVSARRRRTERAGCGRHAPAVGAAALRAWFRAATATPSDRTAAWCEAWFRREAWVRREAGFGARHGLGRTVSRRWHVARRGGRPANDIGFHHDVAWPADHQQVFDVVAANDDELAPSIHGCQIDHREAGLTPACGGIDLGYAKPAHNPGRRADQQQHESECDDEVHRSR